MQVSGVSNFFASVLACIFLLLSCLRLLDRLGDQLVGGFVCGVVHPIWAEKGRRWELDGEGGAPKRTAMATAVWGLISAGVGHGRARGGAEWVRGEVARLGVRRIKAGQRGLAGATSGSVQLELCTTRA